MRKTIGATVWISCFGAWMSTPGQVLGQPRATVTIRVVDEFDRTVTCRMEKFTARGNGAEFATYFKGLKGLGIPHGSYDYVLRRNEPGVVEEIISGTVSIGEPEVLIIRTTPRVPPFTGLAILDSGPFTTYSGKLDPMPPPGKSGEPIWVRLTSIQRSQHWEVSVDPSGGFRIYDWLYGVYILSVIRGDEVLHVQPIAFESRLPAPFVIRMPQTPPSMLHVSAEQAP
jgi:hypothetical protein